MSSGERAAFAGQITDLPVSELLRTVVHGKQTGLARFQTNLGSATLWFREGTIVDADMGRFHMGAAVRRLLTADTGTFEIEFKPISRRRLIKEDTQELLDSVEPPAPPEMMRTGPRRARPAPGWTPTAGGKGATRDEDVSGEHEVSKPAPPTADTRRRLEELGRTKRPSDSALHATGAIGAVEDEDENLTRVAKLPDPSLVALPDAALVTRRDMPPTSVPLQRGSTLTTPAAVPIARPEARPQTPARHGDLPPIANVASEPVAAAVDSSLPTFPQSWAETPTPPALDLDRSPSVAPVSTEASSSATAMGYKSHLFEDTANHHTPTPVAADESVPRRRTQMGIPQPSAHPSPPPAEPRRPSGTDKLPVQEPGRRRRASAEGKASDGTPDAIENEELSDPIPIGTTWEAPSYVSERVTERSGEIRRRGAVAPSLPFQKTTPEPGGTVTDGFRPHATKPITDSYPTVEPGESSRRVTAVAASIGLDPSASGVGEVPRVPAIATAPAVVGRYEVLLRIARGGMGTVYLCRVTGAGGFRRLFALKVIRDHLSRNSEYVTMLLQEARIASRLHHPNVVGIVDIGTLANQHYLVMDYVEGCTFSELLKVHRKSRPPQLVIPIVLDALTGLHAAHSLVNDDGSPLTLVHCDFSPQNMLVGTNGICRITDFGIARASNALPERSSITRGKPAYLAPEQVLGRPFDHRADVFAAGVVLWNALTGEQLFGGDTPEEMLEKVLHRPIQPPSQVGLRPPRSLDRVVMRALQREPAARYQTAEAMLIDLRRVAITEDLLAPASEVAGWVTDTFGTQLELRRQAAGIVAKPGPSTPRDSREISVPELGLGPDASGTHTLTHVGGDTHPEDMESRTVMLHTGAEAAAIEGAMLGRRERNLVFGIAAAMAGIAIALAFMRPGWLLGGFLDEDGTYFEPDPPIELPEVVEVKPPEAKGDTKAKPETKTETPGETKIDAPVDTKIETPVDTKIETPVDTKTEPLPEPTIDAPIEPAPEAAPKREPVRPPTPKPDKPKPKSTPKRPDAPLPPKEPPAEPPPEEFPGDPPPEEPPEPEPEPPPAKEEPTLPRPPDLKELLDGKG